MATSIQRILVRGKGLISIFEEIECSIYQLKCVMMYAVGPIYYMDTVHWWLKMFCISRGGIIVKKL